MMMLHTSTYRIESVVGRSRWLLIQATTRLQQHPQTSIAPRNYSSSSQGTAVVAGAQFPNHHKAGRWTPWSIALFFDRSAHCFELPRTPPPTDAGTNEGVSEHKTQEIYSATPQSLRLSNMCRHDYIHASVTGNRVAKIRQVAAEIPPQSSFEFLQYPADQFI